MEKEKNWNVIIYLKFPIHFNKFLEPACSVDSIDLIVFKGTLSNRLHFIEIYLFPSLKDLSNKKYEVIWFQNISVLLKHSNEYK